MIRAYFTAFINLIGYLPLAAAIAYLMGGRHAEITEALFLGWSPLLGIPMTVAWFYVLRKIFLNRSRIGAILKRHGVTGLTKTRYGWVGFYREYGVRVRAREPSGGNFGGAVPPLGPRGRQNTNIFRGLNPTYNFEDGGILIWKPSGQGDLVQEASDIDPERIIAEAALGCWMTPGEGNEIIQKVLHDVDVRNR